MRSKYTGPGFSERSVKSTFYDAKMTPVKNVGVAEKMNVRKEIKEKVLNKWSFILFFICTCSRHVLNRPFARHKTKQGGIK